MTAYYNENDPKAAAWLRELIRRNLIAPGVVDTRSIEDVQPSDLDGFSQHHFFAGIGGWSYALRLAGWPDSRPVVTGSCPCQPFSAAGKRKGTADERHLWPAWHWLIVQRQPDVIFGEQVASPAGIDWFATVRHDLEAAYYSVGGFDLCAAGVGAPHIRQRLYFAAHSRLGELEAGRGGEAGKLVHTGSTAGRWHSGAVSPEERASWGSMRREPDVAQPSGEASDVGNADNAGSQGRGERRHSACQLPLRAASVAGGFWSQCDWIPCGDGKHRPIEPGTFPLAHGLPARVGRLRGYGNAIVPQVAAEVIKAYMDYTK